MKGRTYNQDYSTRQYLIQIRWRNQKLYRQAQAKRIQHHQTSSTTNAKGTSLSEKHKRRKGPTKTNTKELRIWS